MSNNAIICPVSGEKINENVARIAAFITIVITVFATVFKLPILLIALGADFALRAFTSGAYSPVKYVSKQLFRLSPLSEKIGDAAPKQFAAGIGFVFSIVIAVFQLTHYYILADSFATVLLFCAALESFAGYCLGCTVYTYAVIPFIKKR